MNEKTSFFFVTSNDVVYIDTYNHPPGGAVVVFSRLQHVLDFCEAIWDLEGHNEKTFGNLAFVNFPM